MDATISPQFIRQRFLIIFNITQDSLSTSNVIHGRNSNRKMTHRSNNIAFALFGFLSSPTLSLSQSLLWHPTLLIEYRPNLPMTD